MTDATPPSTTGTTPSPTADWPAETADRIDELVRQVRAKTTVPAERTARVIVYGILALLLVETALVLLAISFVRLVDSALPGEVWSAHAVVGGSFVLVGLLLWLKRPRRS